MCYYFSNMIFKQINLLQKIKNIITFNLGESRTRERELKRISELHRKALVKAGKQQFEKLKDLGLSIPVNLA